MDVSVALGCAAVVVARIVDVSLGTLRMVSIIKGGGGVSPSQYTLRNSVWVRSAARSEGRLVKCILKG